MPTTQPNLLTIFIEEVKLGREAAHEANEAGWPAAFARARAPETYLALETMTGANEVWFITPYASYAAEGETMRRNRTDPVLSAELDRLWREDAEFLVSARTVQAVARPDLSYGAFPDISRTRFWDITMFRVRPGYEAQFDEAAKMYGEISKRLAPNSSYRTYMVMNGMPGGTYIIFSSVTEYAGFDQMLATGQAVGAGMTAKERTFFETFSRQSLISATTNRFRLNPAMSYVDAATKAADPEFWNRR
ncbi:MAG: hypothetical protein L0271_04340 [Gemmatimonadetes bacterium]|nr:hypothetical protein [Gemmatimonadota bacterium]